MSDFYFRTESIKKEDVINLFVESQADREIIESFKSKSHVILEGSRGAGKSYLMRVAQYELENKMQSNSILPVYVTFMQSALIHTDEASQFYCWMLAKIIRESVKVFRKNGFVISQYANSLAGFERDSLSDLVEKFESTYKTPNQSIDVTSLPELSDFMDAIEEICDANNIQRLVYFFDESAHVFRPEQQRQFFSLFRDFKSPYISCNASVYPGVTHYGSSFELTHDAIFKRIERDIFSLDYLNEMRQIVVKQGGSDWEKEIAESVEYFNTLAFCAAGNPRLLLKTLEQCTKLKSANVNTVIKNFYRSEIWSEHSQLGEKYRGHKSLVDWGRSFIEDVVIPATIKKNDERLLRENKESTIYFWIHKDSPQQVKEALRLLTYTGIIRKFDSGVKASKSAIGDRYEIKVGCILAQYQSPVNHSQDLLNNIKLDFFTEYGSNNSEYSTLTIDSINELTDRAFLDSLQVQLNKSITTLGLTDWQKNKLLGYGIDTIAKLLEVDEQSLIDNLDKIGEVRARTMKNSAIAELLETISG